MSPHASQHAADRSAIDGNRAEAISSAHADSADRAAFTYERLALPGGWSGEVLTDFHCPTIGFASAGRLPEAAEWIEPLVILTTRPGDLPGCRFLKSAKTTEVLRATIELPGVSLDVVCKKTSPHNLARRIATSVIGSRARRNRTRAIDMLRAGIGTALPLAIVERRGSGACEWLVSEEIPDTVDLDQIALSLLPKLSPHTQYAAKATLIQPLVDVFRRLEAHGLRHRDLKASNFLVTNWNGAEPAVWIVDLDGLRRASPVTGGGHKHTVKGLTRLTASLLEYASVTRGDYGRFLKCLLSGTGAASDEWKRQLRTVAKAARDYARTSLGRKGHKLDGYAGD